MSQDLSSAFGEPATSRLRGLLPPRTGREKAPAEPDHHEDDHAADRATAHATGGSARPAVSSRRAAEGSRSTAGGDARPGALGDDHTDDPAPERPKGEDAPAPPARRRPAPSPASGTGIVVSPTSSTNRRWGMARVVSREHVDLLVLCALREGPASARGIIERLRAESGGALQAPERTVHNTLHRLARNRLLHRVHGGTKGGPHYGLTATGERAAQSRARQWRLFARAVGDVVGEPDPR